MRANKRSHEKDREIWFEALSITSQSSRVSFQQLTWCMDVGTTWNNAVSEGPLKEMFIFTQTRSTGHYTLGSSFAWKNCKKERFLNKVAFRVVVFLFLSPARCCFFDPYPILIFSFSENGLVNKLLWSVWYVPGNVLNRNLILIQPLWSSWWWTIRGVDGDLVNWQPWETVRYHEFHSRGRTAERPNSMGVPKSTKTDDLEGQAVNILRDVNRLKNGLFVVFWHFLARVCKSSKNPP